MARRFAAGGYNIVAVARRQDRLEQLARDLAGTAQVEILAGDVSAPGIPEQAVAAGQERFRQARLPGQQRRFRKMGTSARDR